MSTLALTRAHRADLVKLTGLASNDLSLIWREFNTVQALRDGLIEVLPRLVAIYGSAAATLGAEYYDEMRLLAGASGTFSGIAADLPDVGRTDALARWGVSPMFSATPTPDSALTLVTGGLQRIISDAERESVIRSSLADPKSAGWKRIGAGACPFCQMLIGRDQLYSEATADFASHDHCHCSAYPLIKGAEPVDVKDYMPTERTITDKDRARVRDYLAAQ